jgi:hypothetical protein
MHLLDEWLIRLGKWSRFSERERERDKTFLMSLLSPLILVWFFFPSAFTFNSFMAESDATLFEAARHLRTNCKERSWNLKPATKLPVSSSSLKQKLDEDVRSWWLRRVSRSTCVISFVVQQRNRVRPTKRGRRGDRVHRHDRVRVKAVFVRHSNHVIFAKKKKKERARRDTDTITSRRRNVYGIL